MGYCCNPRRGIGSHIYNPRYWRLFRLLMAWTRYTNASVSADTPRALGTCDRCGFVYQRDRLAWQLDWRGPRMQNLRILVCPTCLDTPQQNGQRVIILPPDPVPIMNPRPDPHMFM